jgi:RimJ/RimL family protein N-acetyltransferase
MKHGKDSAFMTVFETDRLLVLHLREDDFDAFYALCSDPEITRYMGDGQPLTAKQSCWGQGLATEFARAMLKTGFECWRLPRIEASIDPRNKASLSVVHKLGMTFVRSDVDEYSQPTLFYALEK